MGKDVKNRNVLDSGDEPLTSPVLIRRSNSSNSGYSTLDKGDFFSSTFFAQFIFLLTGVVSTILAQYAFYNGAAEPTALLPVAANYYGMTLAFFLPRTENVPPPTLTRTHNVKIIMLALLDVVAHSMSLLGIIFAGSGIYQVLYSCIVVLTAVWASLFLKKRLLVQHWLAIGVVTAGLLSSVAGQEMQVDSDEANAWKFYFGLGCTMATTVLYSFHYVFSEHIMTYGPSPPTPYQLQIRNGMYCTAIITIYLLLYTLPNFDHLVVAKVDASNGSYAVLGFVYLGLVLSAFGHSVTFFRLLGSVGSVSTGILQSLRAVSVFGISALLFCRRSESQCFTLPKGIATALVISGIIWFSRTPTENEGKDKDRERVIEMKKTENIISDI